MTTFKIAGKASDKGNERHRRPQYIPRPSKAWRRNDEGARSFYVYILKLDDGAFYVGQTRELRERLLQHRDGKTPSTAGRNLKLQYFEILPSRESAMTREVEIRTAAKGNNREILRMVISFRDLVDELDLG